MILEKDAGIDIMNDTHDFHRKFFGKMTDAEILDLRNKYKKYEEVIFGRSWEVPSLIRFQETCAAVSLSFDLATKTSDKNIIFCPWIYEAFSTLLSPLIESPTNLKEKKEIENWCEETQKKANGMCVSLGCMGDFICQYSKTVYPDVKVAPGGLLQTWGRLASAFMDVTNPGDKNKFVEAASNIFFEYNSEGVIKVRYEVFDELKKSCLTMGWPNCARTEDDNPSLITNPSDDEICQMLGIKPPPPEERDRIKKEVYESVMYRDLEDGEKDSSEFFNDISWMRKSNHEIGMWRIVKSACRIARKAVDYRDFYYNKSREAPCFSISNEISSSESDSFLAVFELFTRQFCSGALQLTEEKIASGDLILPMIRVCGAVKAMLHFLDGLPHDRHLSTSRRAFTSWYNILASVIRGQINLKEHVMTFHEKCSLFCTELAAASDILNERETEIHDKNSSQKIAPVEKFQFTEEKMFSSAKDINYVAYLEHVESICREVYREFGEDTSIWPRQLLPFGAAMELLLIIDASERLKERLKGNDVPPDDIAPLHCLLNPRESRFLKIFKKICEIFPMLTDDEYTEGLYEQLFSVGFMSEFYLSLSTTDEGVRIMPSYREYWEGSFTETFCSLKEKKKPNVLVEQTMGSYKIIESCFIKLAHEAEVQVNVLYRKLYAEGKLPPGNISFESNGTKEKSDLSIRLSDESVRKVTESLLEQIGQNPIRAQVVGFDANAKKEIKLAVNAKMNEKTYFTHSILSSLFDVSVNTPGNWLKGIGTPEGFMEAYNNRNYNDMLKCAEKYKANRGRLDAFSTKRLIRGVSEEEIYKNGGNRGSLPF